MTESEAIKICNTIGFATSFSNPQGILSDTELAQIIMCPNEAGFDGNKCTGHCCECTRRWLEAERKVEE